MGKANEISFYRVGDAYGEFSNFAPFPIEVDAIVWPTSEHYFQAMKFERAADQEEIRAEPSPMNAATMGRDRNRKLRSDWESVKIDVMRTAVIAKFSQHAELKRLLLETGTAKLVERTKNDSFWADGGDGSGENWLGKILEEVRTLLDQNE